MDNNSTFIEPNLPEYLSTKQVAKITGLSKEYLDKLRMFNSPDGPPYFRVGRRCLYPRAALSTWAAARLAATAEGAR